MGLKPLHHWIRADFKYWQFFFGVETNQHNWKTQKTIRVWICLRWLEQIKKHPAPNGVFFLFKVIYHGKNPLNNFPLTKQIQGSGQRIIIHPPGFYWNKRISLTKATIWGDLGWGRYNLTRRISTSFNPCSPPPCFPWGSRTAFRNHPMFHNVLAQPSPQHCKWSHRSCLSDKYEETPYDPWGFIFQSHGASGYQIDFRRTWDVIFLQWRHKHPKETRRALAWKHLTHPTQIFFFWNGYKCVWLPDSPLFCL